MSETVNLRLHFIAPQQAQKHVTHNEALVALDRLDVSAATFASRMAAPAAVAAGAAHDAGHVLRFHDLAVDGHRGAHRRALRDHRIRHRLPLRQEHPRTSSIN